MNSPAIFSVLGWVAAQNRQKIGHTPDQPPLATATVKIFAQAQHVHLQRSDPEWMSDSNRVHSVRPAQEIDPDLVDAD